MADFLASTTASGLRTPAWHGAAWRFVGQVLLDGLAQPGSDQVGFVARLLFGPVLRVLGVAQLVH